MYIFICIYMLTLRFLEHYCLDRENEIEDFVITLLQRRHIIRIKETRGVLDVQTKTYALYGLNERDVNEAF